jgi:hypothetical protein
MIHMFVVPDATSPAGSHWVPEMTRLSRRFLTPVFVCAPLLSTCICAGLFVASQRVRSTCGVCGACPRVARVLDMAGKPSKQGKAPKCVETH